MNQQFTIAAGSSANSIALPGGNPINSIQIDNASGSWLYIVSEKTYCPPYTNGFVLVLSYSQASITILSQAGPSGQQSTSVGDPWTVIIDTDDTVTPSQGYPYVNKSGQPEWTSFAESFNNATTRGSLTSIVPSATQRVRVLSIQMLGAAPVSSSNANIRNLHEININLFYQPSTIITVGLLWVGQNKPVDMLVYNPPLDLPVGQALQGNYTVIGTSNISGDAEQFGWSIVYALV